MDRRTWLCAALLVGCAPSNPGLIFAGVLAPSQDCGYDVSNATQSVGVLDVSTTTVSYFIGYRAVNQLIDLGETGDDNPPMANPNHLNMREIEVEVRDIS